MLLLLLILFILFIIVRIVLFLLAPFRNRYPSQQSSEQQYSEGETTVQNPQKKEKVITKEEGEYVDFEEM